MNISTTKVAWLVALLTLPLVNNSFGAAIIGIDPKTTVTASMDGGILKTGNTWYELGVNTASSVTGLATGIIAGQTDPLSTYLIRPANGPNVLMLDPNKTSGTLTLSRPLSVTALSLAAATGNGTGAVTPTLHFTDGSVTTLPSLTVGDWFGQNPRVQTTHGRIDIGANTFQNVGDDNPRVLAINTTLSLADQAKTISSVDLSWTGSGTDPHTMIFGLSGDVTGIGHFTAIPLDAASFNQDIIVGVQEVPEPSTIALIGLGALSLFAFARRKNA